jgi:hypothetical protein
LAACPAFFLDGRTDVSSSAACSSTAALGRLPARFPPAFPLLSYVLPAPAAKSTPGKPRPDTHRPQPVHPPASRPLFPYCPMFLPAPADIYCSYTKKRPRPPTHFITHVFYVNISFDNIIIFRGLFCRRLPAI